MTDPAQVTEPVSWWQGALGGGGLVTVILGAFTWLTKRTDASAQVETAQIGARVAMSEADAKARRAEEEEQTGRHEIDQPIAERGWHAERAERVATQAKYEQSLFTIKDLDRELAAAKEQVSVLRSEVESLTEITRQQAAAIFQLHADNEKLLDWIEANLPSRQPLPRRAATPANGIDIARIPVARRDPRREP